MSRRKTELIARQLHFNFEEEDKWREYFKDFMDLMSLIEMLPQIFEFLSLLIQS